MFLCVSSINEVTAKDNAIFVAVPFPWLDTATNGADCLSATNIIDVVLDIFGMRFASAASPLAANRQYIINAFF